MKDLSLIYGGITVARLNEAYQIIQERRKQGKPRPTKPGEVGPDFVDVIDYAWNTDYLDLSRIGELEGRFSHINGNKECDVLNGPCACGEIHKRESNT